MGQGTTTVNSSVMKIGYFGSAENAQLREVGHVRLRANSREGTCNRSDLVRLMVQVAEHLGTTCGGRKPAGIDTLRPVDSRHARMRSLSAMYGCGTQPWHMDTAHWATPARYLVLGCVAATPASAATDLLDWKELVSDPNVRAAAHIEPFRIRNGRDSFYATMLNRERPFLRHDPGCMEALSDEGRSLQAIIERAVAPTSRIRWTPGMIVVFDNWHLLHRRTDAHADRSRELLRVTVLSD